MLAKLRARLSALSRSLGIQTALRDRAVRRTVARHKEQVKFERQQEEAEDAAEAIRKRASIMDFLSGARLYRKATRKEEKAQRLEARAAKARAKAIVWKGRARKLTQRLEGIATDLAEVKAQIAELGPKVDFEKQTCRGGEFGERWRLSNLTSVQRCIEGKRRNAYSQAGTPDIWHPYGPGPAAGRRDDCSSYITSQALATGADDPNGCDFRGEGFTGTLVGAHGRWVQVSLKEMIAAGHGYIVYGDGNGYHTEAFCPSETEPLRTVGHGSAPVDFATVHAFGIVTERYYVYAV